MDLQLELLPNYFIAHSGLMQNSLIMWIMLMTGSTWKRKFSKAGRTGIKVEFNVFPIQTAAGLL